MVDLVQGHPQARAANLDRRVITRVRRRGSGLIWPGINAILITSCAILGIMRAWPLLVVAVSMTLLVVILGQSVARNYRNLRSMAREVREEVVRLRSSQERTQHSLDRLGTRMKTIDNIAGSVGRAAPLIRAIDSGVTEMRRTGTAAVRETGQPGHSMPRPVGSEPATDPQDLPEATSTRSPVAFPGFRVMMIADEFTIHSFSTEWTLMTPGPDTWAEMLTADRPDLLFVESAWNGNDGAWLYHFVGPSAPRRAVVDLVAACRSLGIPTLFWNKEDPPHFEQFLPTAKLFDWVATTDGDLVGTYRDRLEHDRVFCLPFAAQHRLHNPVKQHAAHRRTRNIVFGGMYFRHKYAERRAQMDTLLPATGPLGLDVFTRHTDKPDYRFPEELQQYVRGSLPYPAMVSAYKAYKVVLNVNSVVESRTMCARRIFEATASGAAVVTMPTPALGAYFEEGAITTVASGQEAFHAARHLLKSTEFRDRHVHRAQRQIWEHHTYTHRAAEVMASLGIGTSQGWDAPTVTVICSTNRRGNVPKIFENYARQTYPKTELVIVTHGFTLPDQMVATLTAGHGLSEPPRVIEAPTAATLGQNLAALVDAADGQYVARMDDDDFYGPNYLKDMVFAQRYSGADLVGKEASYLYFERLDATYLTFPTREHCKTQFVRGATFFGHRDTFLEVGFTARTRGEDSDFLTRFGEAGGQIYAADRFNFIAHRGRDKGTHTWTASDLELASTGAMKTVGDGRAYVSV